MQGGVQHILVRKSAIAQLAEVTADTSGTSFQVFGSKGMPFQFALKLVVEAFHLFQSLGFHIAQHIPVEFQRIRSTQALP